jgi:Stress responsive A/B Barrel Domain
MVEHILLMRWTEGASQEAIDRALEELRGLKGKIAGIVDLSCGANFSDRAKGYTHGLVMRFTDRAALEAYYPHPEHQRVVQKFINPIRADNLALDYEF